MHAADVTEQRPTAGRRAYDDTVRDNVKARRAQLRIDQESLAKRMCELGFKWVRQTVGSVENGSRRLSVTELLGVSLALETSISAMSAPDTSIPSQRAIELPNGEALPATTISMSAGIGHNDGLLRWEGDTAIWPSAGLIEAASYNDGTADMRERTDDGRRALARGIEEYDTPKDLGATAQQTLLRVVTEGLRTGVITHERAEEMLGKFDGDNLTVEGVEGGVSIDIDAVRAAIAQEFPELRLASTPDLKGGPA